VGKTPWGLKGRVSTCPQAVAESKAASHAAAWMTKGDFLAENSMLLGIFWGMDAFDDKGLDFGCILSFTDSATLDD